jgi:chorismate mutase
MADEPMAAVAETGDDRPDPQTTTESAATSIASMRQRIDEIDNSVIRLWRERAGLSQQIGVIRIAAGGTRLVLSRENEILERFRDAIGTDGTQLALLILRAGRGPLRA